jgi:uncharacterized protein
LGKLPNAGEWLLTKQVIFFRIIMPLLYGFLGGGLFPLLKLPAGFLSGGLIAMTIACLNGVKLACPPLLKQFIFLTLGLILGAAVTPETVNRMVQWPLSLLGLTVMMGAITYGVTLFFVRVAKWDRPTAFFAAVPGALSFVLALASTYKDVDTRKVALSQSLRLIALVVILPLLLAAFGMKGQEGAVKAIISAQDAGILCVGALIAGLIAQTLRVPAGMLVGGMIGSALLYGTGLVRGEMPFPVQVMCFLLLALMIAERFNGVSLKELQPLFKASIVGFLLATGLSMLCSLVVSFALKLPLGQVLLGFAPGGIEGMMIIAFIFDLDPAYVGAHHLFRFLLISFTLPFLVRLALK